MAVEAQGRQAPRAIAPGGQTTGELVAQGAIRRMAQQATPEVGEGLFDASAQTIAHAPTDMESLLLILFEQTVGSRIAATRQARAVEQAIEEGKLTELVPLEHRAQVKLQVDRPGKARGVAQEAQAIAIGHHPPELLRRIEILLHERVGRDTGAPGGSAHIEVLLWRLDMDREGVLALIGAMGEGEGAVLDEVRARIAHGGILKAAEEREHPELAGEGRRRLIGAEVGAAGLEALPLDLGQLPDAGDIIGEGSGGGEAKILGALTGEMTSSSVIEDLGGEEATLGGNGSVGHSGSPWVMLICAWCA